MANYSQANRPIRVDTVLGADVLLLERVTGEEHVSAPFRFTLDMLSENASIAAKSVLGTAATVRQKYVDDLEAEFAQGKRLIRHACPELVEAAEAKLRGETPDPAVFEAAVEGLLRQPDGEKIDTVVLACTHFPLVKEELRTVMGDKVRFIDGAQGIARRIAYLTQGQAFLRTSPDVAVVTGEIAAAEPLARALKTYGLERLEQL